MQGFLDSYAVGGKAQEVGHVFFAVEARGYVSQYPTVVVDVDGVLVEVEEEAFACERPIGKFDDERVRQYASVDRSGQLPDLFAPFHIL